MELSNELRLYIESHPEGLKLREIPDELLFEMLENATKCKIEKNGTTIKGTDAFQRYFKLDMSYTTAREEPKLRGYEKVWKKKETKENDSDNSEIIEIVLDGESLPIEETFKIRSDVFYKWIDFLDSYGANVMADDICEQIRKTLARDEKIEDWNEFAKYLPSKDDMVSAALVLFMDMFGSQKANFYYTMVE